MARPKLSAALGSPRDFRRSVKSSRAGRTASPVAADGKLYLTSEDGKVAVLRAGGDWDVLAVNDLGESCYATPALSQGQIYLRTGEALYCFGAANRAQLVAR